MSIFGGNTGITYEQLQQRRKMADQLRAQNSQMPQNVGQGIHAIAKALVARGMDKQNTKRTAELKDKYSGVWGDITGSLSGGQPTATPFNPSMSGASSGGGQSGGGGMERYRNAIASIESDGSGGYQAIGPTHPEMGRALGRYQVMEANLPQWSREAVGREVTPEEYLASPEIQDAIFDRKFGGYVDQFGEQGAAQAWFAGPGGVGKTGRRDSLGTSVGEYTNKFQGAMGGGQGGGVRTAQAGGIDPSIAQMAQLLSAPDEFMPPGQKAVVQALLQRKLQASDPMRALDMQMKQAQLAEMQQPDPMQDLNMQLKQAQLDQMQNPQPDLPGSVQEYQFAQQQGFGGTYQDWLDRGESDDPTTTAVLGLKQRAAEAGLEPGSDAYREFMIQGGADKGMSLEVGPDGGVSFTTGGKSAKALTEGQSKDTVYATRAEGALPTLDKYEQELAQLGERALDADPTGLLRGRMQSQEYQMARQAGDEFLQAILRKDTGAAITSDEQVLYGKTYLPQPGDGPEVIAQKRQSRKRALEAIKAGLPPSAIVQQELALRRSGGNTAETETSSEPETAPPNVGAGADYSGMSMDDLIQNVPTTDAEAAAWNKRFDALQGGQ